MIESEKFLNDYIKAILKEVIKEECPELKEFANTQNEMNNKINKIYELCNKSETLETLDFDKRCAGKVKYRSYGVYEEISDMFDEYAEKHPRYSKILLMSQALAEFMEKYKK